MLFSFYFGYLLLSKILVSAGYTLTGYGQIINYLKANLTLLTIETPTLIAEFKESMVMNESMVTMKCSQSIYYKLRLPDPSRCHN